MKSVFHINLLNEKLYFQITLKIKNSSPSTWLLSSFGYITYTKDIKVSSLPSLIGTGWSLKNTPSCKTETCYISGSGRTFCIKFQISSSKNVHVIYNYCYGAFFSAGIRDWLDRVRNFKVVITRSFPVHCTNPLKFFVAMAPKNEESAFN